MGIPRSKMTVSSSTPSAFCCGLPLADPHRHPIHRLQHLQRTQSTQNFKHYHKQTGHMSAHTVSQVSAFKPAVWIMKNKLWTAAIISALVFLISVVVVVVFLLSSRKRAEQVADEKALDLKQDVPLESTGSKRSFTGVLSVLVFVVFMILMVLMVKFRESIASRLPDNCNRLADKCKVPSECNKASKCCKPQTQQQQQGDANLHQIAQNNQQQPAAANGNVHQVVPLVQHQIQQQQQGTPKQQVQIHSSQPKGPSVQSKGGPIQNTLVQHQVQQVQNQHQKIQHFAPQFGQQTKPQNQYTLTSSEPLEEVIETVTEDPVEDYYDPFSNPSTF